MLGGGRGGGTVCTLVEVGGQLSGVCEWEGLNPGLLAIALLVNHLASPLDTRLNRHNNNK